MKKSIGFIIACLLLVVHVIAQNPLKTDLFIPTSVKITAEQDHQNMMDQLHITSLRSGANGSNANAPNAANYDESKANPFPDLPDPLKLSNGKKVTSAKVWWNQRRPEIKEDFDREIYGRVPAGTPKVNWEVTSTVNEKVGEVNVITKKLIGHVDNSSYPADTVNIQLTLTTPAVATGPVYTLLGKKDLGTVEFPPVETTLIDGNIGFRQHSGGHTDVPNWPIFITFASKNFK